MNKAQILIVEDDPAIRNLIATALETQQYVYHTAATGQQALLEAVSQNPDIILLDLGLPDIEGVDFIRKVRTWSIKPIIVVSARGEDNDKIEALDAGADDYLTKPFSVDELLARLRTSIRRLNYAQIDNQDTGSVFINGNLKIEYAAGCVYMAGKEIHVTPIEYKLLCLLARNVGKVLTHNYVLGQIWVNVLQSDLPSLRVFMATLRKKIEIDPAHPQYRQTHIGVGYRMVKIEECAEK